MSSSLQQFFPPTSKFSVDDVPDLAGKVIIVTGGNSGIGKETAKALLQHNAKVYIAARSAEKSKAAIDDLKAQTGKQAEFLLLDLADLTSVKRAAAEFAQKESRLHVLFNNAGVMEPPIELVTAQNYDLTFGTNVLGHFYLTKLLLPILIETATPGNPSRVISTSSYGAQLFMGKSIMYNTLKDGPPRKKVTKTDLYSQSKFGQAAFSNELFRRYGDQGIMSVALNPGNLRTELGRHFSALKVFLIGPLLYPAAQGALTPLWAATTAEGASFGGKYLIPWARIGESPSKDAAAEKELWNWLEEQVVDI
ncbi:NAD(P)-binding protein [Mycena metata]|uniref:NAD(P)-binding protein n=1 Tax=Mycena metata TaxID=1033252 RepID=A0AAD7NXZ3_9AGAR|nr:NAD(P)-binding protein [Mycena metata]